MAGERPNILWICSDSQRFDTLGCYGNTHVRSPNIDRLASQGVLFENCFAQNPLCTPSRGAFLTGRYPVTNKLRQNGQNILPGEVLVTKTLAEHAYINGLSGKLHLSACNRRFTLGDKWWELSDEEQVIQGVEPRIDDGYQEFHWDHAPSPKYRSSSYNRWVQEHGSKIETPARDDCPGMSHGMPAELHQTTFCAQKAIEFIKAYAGYAHPWLFSVNIFDPHFHCDPIDEYLDPYLSKLDEIPLPNYVEGELENKPHWQLTRHKKCKLGGYTESDTGDDRTNRMLRAGYWAMCDFIDVQVGRMLDALEKTGQRDNTIVIFTSDHGEMLGDHGLYIKGPFLYDPAVQVPLIVSWPGHIPENKRSPALTELADLAPTVLDAAGLSRNPGMQAKSLWPMLTGEAPMDAFRDDVYCEYYNGNNDKPSAFLTMVRTRTHKLVVAHGTGSGELYDLAKDPGENNNLWDDPASASVKSDMLLRMTDRMAQTADPLPERVGIF